MERLASIPPFRSVEVPSGGPTAAAYPAAVGLYVIFDRRPGVHRLAFRFLLDLAYAKWRFPEGFHEKEGARKPARKSMKATAERLANFLDWADRRARKGLDLRTCSYAQCIGAYRDEMQAGVWSRSGEGLANATVEARVEVAVQYLRWLADIGERDRFDVLTKEVTQAYGRHDNSRRITRKMVVRADKLKRKPQAPLTLLTKPQALEWLKDAKQMHGSTFGLMGRSILLTGMRREELRCLRVDSLPLDPSDWEVVNPTQPPHLQEVLLSLEWGCKGGDLGTCPITGDKRGAGRTIRVPRPLALEWHEYQRKARVKALAKRLDGLKGKAREDEAARAVHLFLRDKDGQRWEFKAIYDAWVSVPRAFPGNWHPHKGRHFWSCMTLWDEVQSLEAGGRGQDNVLSIIMTRIQPQLGHLSKETTMKYLCWAMNQLGTPLVLDETDEETGADLINLDDEDEDEK
jgi:hypothetical protein